MSNHITGEIHDLVSYRSVETRIKLGKNEYSPINVFLAAQSINALSIVRFPMKDHLSGIYVKTDTGVTIIALNSSMSLGRQNFSLAHELYHHFYDTNMMAVCGKKISQDGDGFEAQADLFASLFLMPDYELISRATKLASEHEDNKLSVQDLIKIEQYFHVSHQAVVNRLRFSPFIDTAKIEEISNIPVAKIAMNMGYDGSLYRPLPKKEQFGTYGQYIDRAYNLVEKGLISNGKYEELLLDAFRADLVYGTAEGSELID